MTATKGRAGTWLGQKINENLWAILCAISTGAGGVLVGMMNDDTARDRRLDEQNARLQALEKHVARIDATQQRRTDFNVCLVRSIDRLNAEAKIEPTCPLEVPE